MSGPDILSHGAAQDFGFESVLYGSETAKLTRLQRSL